MFRRNFYNGTGTGFWSMEQIVTVILSLASALALIMIIANFSAVTAKIAIGVVSLLTSWVPILVVIALLIIGFMKLKRNVKRSFWRL